MENENQDQNNELNEMLEDDNHLRKLPEPKLPPLSAALLGLLGVFILYQFGGGLLIVSILGFDFTSNIMAFRILTIFGQFLFIFLPALILCKMVYDNIGSVIRLKYPDWKEIFVFAFGLILLNIALQSYLYIQNFLLTKLAAAVPFISDAKNLLDQFDKNIEESYSKLLISNSASEALLVILVVAVTPAICEEVFFRGYVQRTFEMRYTAFKSALFTGIFFGLYHFHPYQIFPLVALGLYFGYAVYKSDSIFVPITLHFLNNFIAIMMFFFIGKQDFSTPAVISVSEFQLSLFLFAALTILFILLMVFFNRNYYRYSK